MTITHSDGYRTQYMHLSQFLLANGASVGKGESSAAPAARSARPVPEAPPDRMCTGT